MSFEGTAIKTRKSWPNFVHVSIHFHPCHPQKQTQGKKFQCLTKVLKKQNWAIIISSYLLHLLDYNIIHTSLNVNGVMRTPKHHVINPSVLFLVACFNKTKLCL